MTSYLKSIHEYVVSILPPLATNGSLCNLGTVVTPTESNCLSYSHPDENCSIPSRSFTLQQSFTHDKEFLDPFFSQDLFGHTNRRTFTPETTVYNMVLGDPKPYTSSAAQATASMNKCLQVYSKGNKPSFEKTIASIRNSKDVMKNLKNPDVHFINVFKTFCGMNKKCENKRCPKRSGNKFHKATNSSAEASDSNQSKPRNVQSIGTSTKAVMIDEKGGIPSNSEEKRREKAESRVCCVEPCNPCPPSGGVVVHGANDKTVKVTTAVNARRGVFEIVIRRLTGAPLGKNELMLEWTPPIMTPPCSTPCWPRSQPYPCGSCAPRKTSKPARVSRLVICPLPYTPKCSPCCKRSCVRPCTEPPCTFCCKPKRPCGPVPPCAPCPPCGAPSSTPCFRSCPVGRRRPRRCRSQPRIRSHPKRESPCHNRAPSCPAVRCSRPCMSCCALPYPPRLSCSTVHSARSRSCKSECLSCGS